MVEENGVNTHGVRSGTLANQLGLDANTNFGILDWTFLKRIISLNLLHFIIKQLGHFHIDHSRLLIPLGSTHGKCEQSLSYANGYLLILESLLTRIVVHVERQGENLIEVGLASLHLSRLGGCRL